MPQEQEWKINNLKLYHVSPYEETIVMDTDMIVLQDPSSWWTFLSNYDLFFTSKVYTYRGEIVKDTYYRKTFIANELPNHMQDFIILKNVLLQKSFIHG